MAGGRPLDAGCSDAAAVHLVIDADVRACRHVQEQQRCALGGQLARIVGVQPQLVGRGAGGARHLMGVVLLHPTLLLAESISQRGVAVA
jgi:hypothetical protein